MSGCSRMLGFYNYPSYSQAGRVIYIIVNKLLTLNHQDNGDKLDYKYT